VVRAGGLGDTLLVLPTVQLLLDEVPALQVTLVGSAWAQELMPLLRAPDRTPRGRDGADLVAGQEARATRIGDQCAKPERHRHTTKDARPCGLRLGPSSAASRLLAATRPEAQRGSRGVLSGALGIAPRLHLLRFDSPLLTPLFGESAAEDATGCFAEAHAAVVYAAAPGGELTASARRFCPGPVIEWPVQPAGGEHAAVHFARAVADPPPDSEELPLPALRVPGGLRDWSARWMASHFGEAAAPAAVHPGSGGARKCWPAERFARLIRSLGAAVLLLEGPADSAPCRRVEQLAPTGTHLVKASGLSVAQAAALLARCRSYVGNDSGLSHLAAALGVPTVAVFGPTDPSVWAPRGPRVRTVQAAAGWPDAGEVLQALAAFPD